MRYYGGERVAISGIYHSAHIFHRDHDADIALTVDEFFPHCGDCRDLVYTLVKAAAGAQEDKDLSEPSAA